MFYDWYYFAWAGLNYKWYLYIVGDSFLSYWDFTLRYDETDLYSLAIVLYMTCDLLYVLGSHNTRGETSTIFKGLNYLLDLVIYDKHEFANAKF